MLINAELTRQKSCGSLMAEFRMRRKTRMRKQRDENGMKEDRERRAEKIKGAGTVNAGK